jgi:hypothetical protein
MPEKFTVFTNFVAGEGDQGSFEKVGYQFFFTEDLREPGPPPDPPTNLGKVVGTRS